MARIVLVLAVSLVLLAGCGNRVEKETLWGVYQEPVKPEALPEDSGVEEMRVLWESDLEQGAEVGFALLNPAIYGDGVFIANRSGQVSRFQADSGELAWRRELEKSVYSAIGVNEGMAVVSHDNGDVTALNAENGETLWVSSLKRQVSAIPSVGRGRVIVRTADGLVIGLDSRNGNTVWQVQKTVPGLSMHGDSPATITGEAVLVGLASGQLIANNVFNGRDYWETEVAFVRGQNEIERLTDSDTTPIVDGVTVYAAAYQGNVVALQLQDAAGIWRSNVSTRLPMALDGGRLFVTAEFGEVVALDSDTGEILWRQPAFRGHGVSRPVALGGRVVIGDSNGLVHTLDPGSGALIETRSVVSGAVAGIVSDGLRFSVFSSEGEIATLGL